MKQKTVKNIASLMAKLDISFAVCLALTLCFYIATYSLDHIADDIFLVLLVLAMITTYYFLRQDVVLPLTILGKSSKKINVGDLQKLEEIETDTPEFLDITTSFNQILSNIERATAFIQQIESGNLDVEFSINADDTSDKLSQALLNMRNTMRQIDTEEHQRNWATQGVAMLSETLRLNNQDVKGLSKHIMAGLVPYLNAAQGSIFVIQEEKEATYHLQMTGMYAYGKQKHIRKQIVVGKKYAEDLIGQVFLERALLSLSKIPDGYLEITSGLGDAPPKNLLLVPLVVDDIAYGVLEIASFHQLQPYQIEFIERVSESIALTIATVRINEQTKILLEESQRQAEQLKSQEEEMRQNVEELAATQEEMARKNRELEVTNAKMIANSQILEKALKKSQQMQKELGEKNAQMAAQEEEMRQNLEELAATQDELSRQKTELESANGKMTANAVALEKAWNKSQQIQKELEEKNAHMFAQEEEMRQNLEELATTQEELSKQKAEIEANNKRLETNTRILEKAYKKSKDDQEQLKQQKTQIEEQELFMRQTFEELQKTQTEMLSHQKELEEKTKKLQTNEMILKKFMDRANESDAKHKATIRALQEKLAQYEK